MSRSLRVRQECIEQVKLAVKRNGFLSQRALSEEVGLALATVSNFLTGKPVDRATFAELCDRLSLQVEAIATFGEEAEPENSPQPAELPTDAAPPENTALAKRQDWGEAIDVSTFFGRSGELATLEEWITQDQCRLVMLIGMGGIGKTALSVKLAEQLQGEFEFLIWRSLRNAPPVEELLADLIQFFSNQQENSLPEAIDARIAQVMKFLRAARCLLVLDNVESILSSTDRAGSYRSGYEGYGQFLSCVGETRHQSCLVLTSREKPRNLSAKAGSKLPIRALRLNGLEAEAGQFIFDEKGCAVSAIESQALIDHYAGNPLALQIVATTIQEVFDGNVAQFLDQGTIIFGDISDLLNQQFSRLSAIERQVMYWLAINREAVSLAALREDMVPTVSQRSLLEAVESLQLRSLIEKSASSFTQQPVVMEYVTEQLIEQVSAEIEAWKFDAPTALFNCCALIKAQAKDYLRNTQIQLILKPVADRWLNVWGGIDRITAELPRLLEELRSSRQPGYTGGNLLNLCWQLQLDVNGSDCSNLTIRQAYLQGMNLHRVNFAQADLSQSVFTQSLGGILCAAFSLNGTLLATGMDCDVCLWQMAEYRQLKVLKGHKGWVQSIAFSPDGQLLASGSSDQTIRLWDLQTGQCLKTLRGHTSWIQSIAFSPDGQLLASGSNDQTVRLWDIDSEGGQCLSVLPGHTSRILSVAFCLDRQTLISSSEDQTVRRWQIETGECLQVLNIHVNWVLSIALSPDGKTLATRSDGKTVKFWDLASGECFSTLEYSAQVWAIAYAPAVTAAPQRLATGSEDRTVKIWDAWTGECLQTLQGHRDRVWLVAFSPDGHRLMSLSEDQTMKFWDVETGQCLRTLEAYSNWVLSVAFSPDGRSIASSSQDQQVRVWDVATGKCHTMMQGHTNLVSSIAFAPPSAGQILASGSDDRTIKLWNWRTSECLSTIWGHMDWVQSVTFSPDGQILASGSRDQTIKLWDWRTGECLQTLIGHSHRVKSIAFDPQGSLLASGSDDQTIHLWDVQTGDRLRTLHGHCDWVLSVAFSPCGKLLASSSGDRTIKLWEVQTGTCLHTL